MDLKNLLQKRQNDTYNRYKELVSRADEKIEEENKKIEVKQIQDEKDFINTYAASTNGFVNRTPTHLFDPNQHITHPGNPIWNGPPFTSGGSGYPLSPTTNPIWSGQPNYTIPYPISDLDSRKEENAEFYKLFEEKTATLVAYKQTGLISEQEYMFNMFQLFIESAVESKKDSDGNTRPE